MIDKPTNHVSCLNTAMATLKERLEEVMKACSWEHADVVRISRQSSSAVSQWLGKGSKEIKTIGKLEAAIYLERQSGYSALWIAKGIGPKLAERPGGTVLQLAEGPGPWQSPSLLEQVGMLLAAVPLDRRRAVADTLRGWAEEGGADHYRLMLETLLQPSKQGVAGA